MENPEAFLQELDEFNRSNDTKKPIPEIFENYIETVSKTGATSYPWHKISKLYLTKLNNVLNNLKNIFVTTSSSVDNFNSSSYSTTEKTSESEIQILKERIVERMQSFASAPFTIQRISELLIKPNSHYNRADKYLRGLEKCIMVVTTVDPYGNKIFIDNLTNGVSRSPSPSTTPKRPSTPQQETNTREEMTTPHFVNDQTIPVIESMTTTMVKSTIISTTEGAHEGTSIQVDESEVTKTTTTVLEAGHMTVETSEVVKETHIEVDESKSHTNGVEMREVDAPSSEPDSKGEKHAHPEDVVLEDEIELEKKKIKLNSSGGGDADTKQNTTDENNENHIEQSDPLISN